jgi:hypothetical protein
MVQFLSLINIMTDITLTVLIIFLHASVYAYFLLFFTVFHDKEDCT